jgi:hypothetical protein
MNGVRLVMAGLGPTPRLLPNKDAGGRDKLGHGEKGTDAMMRYDEHRKGVGGGGPS